MSTFLTIPYEEIKKFLLYYDLPISEDHEENYLIVWNYILDHPKFYLPSIYLEDFILAYNHQGDQLTIHKTSDLLTSSEESLVDLSQSLGLLEVDKERIIRILGYLNLLDNDTSFFDRLPRDVLWTLGLEMDCHSLGLLCRISSQVNQLLCKTGDLENLMKNQVTKDDPTKFGSLY
jgi:hypothetical protein